MRVGDKGAFRSGAKFILSQIIYNTVVIGVQVKTAGTLTLTEMFTDGILMTAVDTGWITDERPHPTKLRLAEEGFHAPLDLVDGAARVYDPIVRGETGEDVHGCFLKDYAPSPW